MLDGCQDGFSKYNTGTCSPCAGNCVSGCDKVSGRCNGCKDGQWGYQCDTSCSGSCGQCTQDTGTCTACSGFFKLPECKECLEGYYKENSWSTRCTECTWQCLDNTVCRNTTGDCADCPPGKTGNRCDQACSPGRYGPSRCAETCGQCNGGPCDAVTGHCAQCQPGWQAPLCKTLCALNTYGENCSESCGRCKGEQPCNATTGECTGECQPGYTGTLCKTECGAGLYGEKCSETCGYCQVNTTCHHEDGHCLVGCVAEFAGPLCPQATSQENKDDGATKLVGPIVGSIFGVGLVMTISVTAAICWRRKSATSRSSVQDPPTASSISVKDAAHTVSPEPSPLRQSSSNEDNLYSEIRDPDDTYEISEMQSIYDKPSPYSNDDGDREPYMQLTLKTNDVNMPASNAAYVNTKLSV
ncbi:scavenger receptor class F member 1-like [Littorina saxatilis]|uniref:scavenger receptor class F member 1-like n=1 Tax=Littorina saxatilis TaxID=31220 RepID=UPI0038B48F3F